VIVTLLTDYGLRDEFVGVLHGVIARIAPEARVIDLAHGIPRHDVAGGARRLARALPWVPPGVHVAVVDPGVGGARRALAVRTVAEGRVLVGPDNGLLALAAERFGGVAAAVEISRSPWRLEPVSPTFHGRDLFAPVAARLAAGAPLGEAGAPLDPRALVPAPLTRPVREADGALVAHVVGADAFGNLELDADDLELPVGAEAEVAGRRARVARTFADVGRGELLLYRDAGGAVALAVREGDAAGALGLSAGDDVRIVLP